MSQPIIRGIQAVGAVDITYRYNNYDAKEKKYLLPIPSSFKGFGDKNKYLNCGTGGIPCCGYRLDSEFLRAMQQIASSVQIPILGGGAVALTNNNRSGTLRINATRVSTPALSADKDANKMMLGSMYRSSDAGIGPKDTVNNYFEIVLLAQLQQAQEGGDSLGARLTISFQFCGRTTKITFEGCTVASVDPVGLSGNDVVDYGVVFNYLDWSVEYKAKK